MQTSTGVMTTDMNIGVNFSKNSLSLLPDIGTVNFSDCDNK